MLNFQKFIIKTYINSHVINHMIILCFNYLIHDLVPVQKYRLFLQKIIVSFFKNVYIYQKQ